MNKTYSKLLIIALLLLAFSQVVPAQTTAFTYQGRLTDTTVQANGTYDLGFALYDAETGGTQIGTAITRPNVTVSNGVFTVQLDFGANAFPGADRYLQIAVKRPSETNYTTLTPRQPFTSTPYSIRALNATNSSNLGGAAANQFVQTNDTRLTDSRTPTAGSANYIQNTTTQQTSANFNVDGTGAASIFNAATQYNFGGSRILGVPNSTSVTLGLNAGNALGSGNTGNTFVGASAGAQCRTAVNLGDCLNNSFFGRNAGATFVVGSGNIFIGNETNSGGPNRGTNNTLIGAGASLNEVDVDHATVIGAGSVAFGNNTIVLGRANGADAVVVHGLIQANGGITSAGSIYSFGSLSAVGNISAQDGISLNDTRLRLRDASDDNHTIFYNSTINGIEFKAFDEFRWSNVRFNNTSMRLSSTGDLAIRGSYQQISDVRYKTDVQTFPSALDTVRRLRGVTFNWKPEANPNPNRQIGFIAQEVEAILPEIVQTDKEGYKTVAYSNAVPVLVEAIKEQQTQIERQQRQIDEQRVLIDGLKTLVCSQNPNANVCK